MWPCCTCEQPGRLRQRSCYKWNKRLYISIGQCRFTARLLAQIKRQEFITCNGSTFKRNDQRLEHRETGRSDRKNNLSTLNQITWLLLFCTTCVANLVSIHPIPKPVPAKGKR